MDPQAKGSSHRFFAAFGLVVVLPAKPAVQ